MDVDLEQLLGAAAVDPARRPEFTKALLDGQVYVLGWLSTPPVDGKAQAGSSMQIQSWTDPDGPITPFFTSESTLRRTLAAQPEGDQRFLRLPTRDFMTMLRGQRLVLDPHGSHGKIFLPEEVEALLEGREPGRAEHVVDADRAVLVGTPANLPPELPRVLTSFLSTRPSVERAHLGWIVDPGQGNEGYLLVVVANDRDTAMEGFGSVQIGEVTGGRTLDVMVVPPSERDHLLAAVEPFYMRKEAGLASRLRARFGDRG